MVIGGLFEMPSYTVSDVTRLNCTFALTTEVTVQDLVGVSYIMNYFGTYFALASSHSMTLDGVTVYVIKK